MSLLLLAGIALWLLTCAFVVILCWAVGQVASGGRTVRRLREEVPMIELSRFEVLAEPGRWVDPRRLEGERRVHSVRRRGVGHRSRSHSAG